MTASHLIGIMISKTIALRIHVGNINTRTNVGLRALHWYVGLRAQHCRIVGALFVECHWFPGGWWLDMVCGHLPSKFVQGLLKTSTIQPYSLHVLFGSALLPWYINYIKLRWLAKSNLVALDWKWFKISKIWKKLKPKVKKKMQFRNVQPALAWLWPSNSNPCS